MSGLECNALSPSSALLSKEDASPLPGGDSRTLRPRMRSRDPADLLDVTRSKQPAPEVKVYNDEDRNGKLQDWNGFTLIDLESGVPDFFGEDTNSDPRDHVGAFACRQMVSDLHMRCGVLIRHLDVPYIEAKGQCSVALQVLDVASDVFFIIELLRDEHYQVVPFETKAGYISIFVISQLLRIGLAAFRAWHRWRGDVDKLLKVREELDVKLTWNIKGRWLVGAFFENLFASPTTILSSRRVVKRMPMGGYAAWIVGYATEAGFKFRYNRGAQSLWPTLLLEDLPLLAFQAYILRLAGMSGPVFWITATCSFASAVHKFTVLWEQNAAREAYRKEVLAKLNECQDSAPNEKNEGNLEFWTSVYRDEFLSDPPRLVTFSL